MVDLGIKQAVKDWMHDKYERWIKQPIEKKTEELENQANQQINTYGNKAKETAYKPVDYYRKQPTFIEDYFGLRQDCWWYCELLVGVRSYG